MYAAHCYRHLERRDAPVWMVKAWGTYETRSREISGRQGSLHHCKVRFLRSAFVEMTGEGISVSLIVWNLKISSFENGGRSREALAFFGSILYNETIKLM